METPLDILNVERVRLERGCGITVVFSDGTYARYPPEELAVIRPHREQIHSKTYSLPEGAGRAPEGEPPQPGCLSPHITTH